MKKLIRGKRILLVLFLMLVAFITKTYLFNKPKLFQENRQQLVQDTKSAKEVLEDESIKVKKVVERISKEVEMVVLKETGSIQLFHDKTPRNNKYIEWIIDSNITLKVYYTAILTIDTKNIDVYYDDSIGKINIVYDLEKIKVTSVNIDSMLSETTRGIFGRKYSENEVTILTFLATDKVKEKISNDCNLIYLACSNLENFFKNISYDLGILNINIINK